MTETLNMWGNGAVTLPKRWREQFPTKHFMAVATPEGLLIKPILDVEYYEDERGFGLRFPMGIQASELLNMMEEAEENIGSSSRKKE